MPVFLRAGAARADISPPADTPLIGYTERHVLHPGGGHSGVLDALHATLLVLDDALSRIVLVSLDLCILETEAANRLRARLALFADTPADHIVLACSHTHSGPYPWNPAWTASPVEDVGPGILGPSSAAYFEHLSDALVSALSDAIADLSPARLRSEQTDFPHAYCRRVRLPAGGVGHAWDARTWTGPAPSPAHDPCLVLLAIERDIRPPILVWNAAAHPVTLGKESNLVSADWPGAVRRRLEAAHPGALTLFLNGASGDAHPFLATGQDTSDLDRVAAPVAGALLALHAAPVERDGPHRASIQRGEERRVPPALTVERDAPHRADAAPSAPRTNAPRSGAFHLAHATVHGACGQVRLTTWDLGVARLLAIPGELFGEDGAALRRACPVPLLLSATSDGWTGYWPPAHEYLFGGYECDSAPRKTTADHDLLLGAARGLLATPHIPFSTSSP